MSFGYDPYDAEWENPNTGRTAYRPSQDDDYCEVCGDRITARDGSEQPCSCETEADPAFDAQRAELDAEDSPAGRSPRSIFNTTATKIAQGQA